MTTDELRVIERHLYTGVTTLPTDQNLQTIAMVLCDIARSLKEITSALEGIERQQ